MARPRALKTPPARGTSTVSMPSSSAREQACIPPAPPKARRANSRGSRPRSTLITRSARVISAFATRTTPRATSSASRPSFSPRAPSAFSESSRLNTTSPPSSAASARYPSSRFASVTVGSSPPLSYPAGPGSAPAEWGPTRRAPPASAQAMEPPPALTVCTSTIGSFMGTPATTVSVGVCGGRGEPLVLPELGQHLAAQGDVHVGERLSERLADPLFVLGVHEREQEAHRDGLDFGLFDRSDEALQATFVQRCDLPLRAHPLRDREAQVARDEGGRAVPGEVVEGGTVLARDLQHVPEALRRHERRPGPAAFEQGVRRHGHPVG